MNAMPIIGTFSAVKDGYAGTIRTLTMSVRVRLVANDRKEAEGAPDFRIVAGAAEIGKLDDPALPQPIWGALFEATDDGPARLVWRRDRRDDG
jgi:uncharacterized protein (DUF736 family)